MHIPRETQLMMRMEFRLPGLSLCLIAFVSVLSLWQTCRHKESVLRADNHQIINLTSSFPEANCTDRMQEVFDYSARPTAALLPSSSAAGASGNGSSNGSIESAATSLATTTTTPVPTRLMPVTECRGSRTFLSRRERWWFIALSNCASRRGLRLRYRFVMTNGNTTSNWNRHFSADQLCTLLSAFSSD